MRQGLTERFRRELERDRKEKQRWAGRYILHQTHRHQDDFHHGVYAPNYVRELASICAKAKRKRAA